MLARRDRYEALVTVANRKRKQLGLQVFGLALAPWKHVRPRTRGPDGGGPPPCGKPARFSKTGAIPLGRDTRRRRLWWVDDRAGVPGVEGINQTAHRIAHMSDSLSARTGAAIIFSTGPERLRANAIAPMIAHNGW